MIVIDYIDYEITQALELLRLTIRNKEQHETDALINAAVLRLGNATGHIKKQGAELPNQCCNG